MDPSRFTFYLFSYNRGLFLENCIASIRRNAPNCPLVIVDDDSTEPETLRVLASLPDDIRVLKSDRTAGGRYGGLYVNMQRAFESATNDGYMVFIQDDMQIVRPLSGDDFQYIHDYFEAFPRAAFLNPQFLMALRKRGILRSISLAPEFPAYFFDQSERWKDRSVRMYYTDILIGHTARLRDAKWQFQDSESSTAVHARTLFPKLGTMAHPFIVYLPEVPVYHGKRKTLAVRLAERIMGVEPRRYADMTPAQTAAFKARDLSVLPFAEDYVRCVGDKQPRKPYQNKGINAIAVLRLLHKVELLSRRFTHRKA